MPAAVGFVNPKFAGRLPAEDAPFQIGTRHETGALASAEVYNPATGTWTTTGSLINARQQGTATVLFNHIASRSLGETLDGDNGADSAQIQPNGRVALINL